MYNCVHKKTPHIVMISVNDYCDSSFSLPLAVTYSELCHKNQRGRILQANYVKIQWKCSRLHTGFTL